MKNRIIILGSNGQLGTALSKLFYRKKLDYLGLDIPEIDITKPETYYDKIKIFKPDTLINCAAFTDVYQAETNIEKAMKINGTSLKCLSDICNEKNIYLVHISSNYVFSGNKGSVYTETDVPDPINIYGITKLIGEKIIQMYSKNYVIIRTASLYGNSKINSTNIVGKLISMANENETIKLVNNEFTSPTFAENLAEQIMKLMAMKLKGIMSATGEGYCNWVEFGRYLFDILQIEVKIEEVNSRYFNKIVKKPKFSVLSNDILKQNRINVMKNWKVSLKEYLNNG